MSTLRGWVLTSVLVIAIMILLVTTLHYNFLTLRTETIYGIAGPFGPTGILGIPGAKGLDGFSGILGPRGYTGPLGVTGITGLPGPFGFAGPPGPQGVTGPTGTGNPQAAGPIGVTGPSGTSTTGPTGSTGFIGGTSGPTGPNANPTPSSLTITYGGKTGGLGPATTVSFTPTLSLVPSQFPILSEFYYGDEFSNFGGNSPGLISPNTLYSISTFLLGNFTTTQVGDLLSPLTCQLVITARDITDLLSPIVITSQELTLARNPGSVSNVYSFNIRFLTEYQTTSFVPVLIGFNATFQCSSIVQGAGILTISPATIIITPH